MSLGLVLAVAAAALVACSGGEAPGEPPEPWATCRAAGTRDTPEPVQLEPAAPVALLEGVRETFDLPDDMPEETVAVWTVWRCVDGEVWACVVGANLPCSEKADTGRAPAEPLREYCRDRPDGETIPAVVTGRATVYTWRCVGGQPEVERQWSEPDARGFHRDLWKRIEPPAGSPASD